jgi:hypothetical protein
MSQYKELNTDGRECLLKGELEMNTQHPPNKIPKLIHYCWFGGQDNYMTTSTIASEKGNILILIFLDSYQDKNFFRQDGSFDEITNTEIRTQLLQNIGIKSNGAFQEIEGLGIFYPQTYFHTV